MDKLNVSEEVIRCYDVSKVERQIKIERDIIGTLKEIRRSVKRNRLTLESRIFYQETVDRLTGMGFSLKYLGTYHCIIEGGRDSKKYEISTQ